MGIFSLFGKKGGKKDERSSERGSSKKARTKSGNTAITGFQDSELFTNSIIAQRHVARATERKIDAIEFEMSRDIVKTRPVMTTRPDLGKFSAPRALSGDGELTADTLPIEKRSSILEFQTTLPMTMPSDYLLSNHTEILGEVITYSESVPVLEEAAILFANGQNDVAEQMLQAAVHHQQLGSATEIGWQMLFDLYRLTNNQHMFESLSLDYANQFETSPPLWSEHVRQPEPDDRQEPGAATPSILFPLKLDASIIKLIEKINTQSGRSNSLKLDFGRVKEVDPVGCGLLLRCLKNLKKSDHDLMLVGAQDLADRIRAILQVGRRDETEAPWLLLLEILQLLHFERAFEEVSMDYCITFEVSPPSFEAPRNNITSAFPEITLKEDEEEGTPSDRFKMPVIIQGRMDGLLNKIAEQANRSNPLILDCTQLERVEFSATAELLNGLAPIAGKPGMSIQFIEVNYLVMMLFNAMGLKNIASISLRKH